MSTAPEFEPYAERLSSPAPEHLAALAVQTRATQTSTQMLSGQVEGLLLQTLVALAKPSLVLEIGTYTGSAAQYMAAALPEGGRVVTCELDPERAAFAQRHIDAGPVADRIEVRVGPALETIASLDGPIGLVFIDADKEGYIDYYEAVLPKLADDGLIVADNTLHNRDVLDPVEGTTEAAIAAFNEHVAADPRTVQVILTIRFGITLIRRA